VLHAETPNVVAVDRALYCMTVTLVLCCSVAHIHNTLLPCRVDLVLVGAEAVVESGGIINLVRIPKLAHAVHLANTALLSMHCVQSPSADAIRQHNGAIPCGCWSQSDLICTGNGCGKGSSREGRAMVHRAQFVRVHLCALQSSLVCRLVRIRLPWLHKP
jgi:hypothetical protein